MAKLVDLTGQKIDKLLVLEQAPSRSRHVYWKCKCDCGNIVEKSGEYLRKNILPRDCGCSKIKNIKKKHLEEKYNYLVGKIFGKLTVINPTDKRLNGSIVWNCKCECGKYKEVPTHLLTSGHTQSCGCLIREIQAIDITNQRFGKLIALYPCDYKKTNSSTILWHCKCDCGNECDINGSNLRLGLTKSCGCINSPIGEQNIKTILDKHNLTYQKEYVVKELNNARFDFAIFCNNKLIRLIEFDGEQHYNEKRGTWINHEPLEIVQERDKKKNEWAKKHNIPLVRIPYWERDNITLNMLLQDQYLI